jgi:hypothetical protein
MSVMQSYSRIMPGPVCSRGLSADAAGAWQGTASLILQTETLQEPRWLSILHGLDLCLCILLQPHSCPCIFQVSDLRSGIMLGPHMCAGIFYGPDLRTGIYDPCLVILDLGLGILYGLHGPDLCIFLCRPSLELLEHGFRWWLRIFGLTLIRRVKGGSNFGARRRLPCSRRQSLSVGG